MKQFISLRSFSFSFTLLCVVVFSLACRKDLPPAPLPAAQSVVATASVNPPAISSAIARTYLDLSKDQMIVGGITPAMLQQYLQQGFVLKTLDRDRFVYKVSFKDRTGKIYYRDGWVKKGSKYIEKTQGVADPVEDFWYECANVFDPKKWVEINL